MADRFQDLRVAGDAVELERAVEAGHHFIGLGVGHLVDAATGREIGDESGAARPVPTPQHHLAKLQVARLAGEPIHPHHGFQHAAGRHARVRPAQHDVLLPGLLAEGPGQQVGDAHAGSQGRLLTRVAVIGEQPDQVVFVRPDIPGCPPLLGQVGAEVAVGTLRREEPGDYPVELGAKRRIAGVGPREGGGVQPLAHMLAIPLVHAGTGAIADQEAILIDDQQAVLLIRRDPPPQEAVEMLLVRLKQLLPVRHLGRDRE